MMMGLCTPEIGILEQNMENCNLITLSEKELINRLVEILHGGTQCEFYLLRFPKRKIFTIRIGSPSFERSCTHVLIGCCASLYYIVDFVDLEHNIAYSYYVSTSLLKTLCDDCFLMKEIAFLFQLLRTTKKFCL